MDGLFCWPRFPCPEYGLYRVMHQSCGVAIFRVNKSTSFFYYTILLASMPHIYMASKGHHMDCKKASAFRRGLRKGLWQKTYSPEIWSISIPNSTLEETKVWNRRTLLDVTPILQTPFKTLKNANTWWLWRISTVKKWLKNGTLEERMYRLVANTKRLEEKGRWSDIIYCLPDKTACAEIKKR